MSAASRPPPPPTPESYHGPLKPWSDEDGDAVVVRIIQATGKAPLVRIAFDEVAGDGHRKSVAGKVYLRNKLQSITAAYNLEAYWQEKPSRSVLLLRLASIQSATARIIAALGIESYDGDLLAAITPKEIFHALKSEAAAMAERIGGFPNHPPLQFSVQGETFPDWFPEAQVRDVLEGVRQLRQWTQGAGERLRHRPAIRPSERNKGDVAAEKLIGDLYGLWLDCYGTRPKLSRRSDNGKPSGPFFRFVQACFDAIGAPYTSAESLFIKIKRTFPAHLSAKGRSNPQEK